MKEKEKMAKKNQKGKKKSNPKQKSISDSSVKTAVELVTKGKLKTEIEPRFPSKGDNRDDANGDDENDDGRETPRGLVHVADSAYAPSPPLSAYGSRRSHRESSATIFSSSTRGDSGFGGSVFGGSTPLHGLADYQSRKDSNRFISTESVEDTTKSGKRNLSKDQQRSLEEAAESLLKKPKSSVDASFDLDSTTAILYFAHNVMDFLYYKGYAWPNAPKARAKGKGGGGGGGGKK